MEFKISELEREPIDFDLQFKTGAIDYGEEAEQGGTLAPRAGPKFCTNIVGPRISLPTSGSGVISKEISLFPARDVLSRLKFRFLRTSI